MDKRKKTIRAARFKTQDDIIQKEPSRLAAPIRELEGLEAICLGFRVSFFEITDDEESVGGVDSGAGMGSPWIYLHWGERKACIHSGELLAAYVGTFDPAGAEKIRKAMGGRAGGMNVSASKVPTDG